ncbi:MAG: homocysteine S-methyltransferase family protein [Pseudolabrys sp.]
MTRTAKYRARLPQLTNRLFLTDGGMETTLIYQDGIDLPCFASFTLLRTPEGVARTRAYYARYAAMAQRARLGFVLETPTWRANADWGAKVGYSRDALAQANRQAIALMEELRAEFETAHSPMVISGNIGPRGDGYDPGRKMSAREAEAYHGEQIAVIRDTAADFVSAFTMNYVEEALGIARAAKAAAMPVVISFTVETDGRLPTGETLQDAIAQVDAETGATPVYYMINCAHPTHFQDAVAAGETWVKRIGGLRANASRRSHAELDQATELDAGDPDEFGRLSAGMRRMLPNLTVLGGCCGTDHRHVEQIALACEAVA